MDLAVAGSGAVAAFGAVMRVPVFRPRVAKSVAVDVAEIPCLSGEDGLVAPGAVVEAGLDRWSYRVLKYPRRGRTAPSCCISPHGSVAQVSVVLQAVAHGDTQPRETGGNP
jgi:hypothetical protein